MALSPSSPKVRCLIRREWLAATPEEVVRQRLLLAMTQDLGYPRSWFCVEKWLTELPHLALSPTQQLPNRRIDILCYATDQSSNKGLNPLILIECKAVPITAKAIRQAIGYNLYVGAPYICLANASEIHFGHYDSASKSYQFGHRIPSYQEISSRKYDRDGAFSPARA
jgi:hypothetical protein